MKYLNNYLYLINSLLCVYFFISLLIIWFAMSISSYKPKKRAFDSSFKDSDMKLPERIKVPVAQIFGRRDIFALADTTTAAAKTVNVTPAKMPELQIPEISKAPEKHFNEFVDPLTVSINGIVISSANAEKNMAVIADETDKEANYKVGDRIKDSTILKIFRDRVVFLRMNGQVETHYLYESAIQNNQPDPASAITSAGDNKFEINVLRFKKIIPNVGVFLSKIDLIPLTDENNKILGMIVNEASEKSLADLLGFKADDLIIKIDGLDLSSNKNRIAAYDNIVKKQNDEELVVEFDRNGTIMKNSYLIKINSQQNLSEKQELAQGSAEKITQTPTSLTTPKENPAELSKLMTNNLSQSNPGELSLADRKKNEDNFQANIERIRQQMLDLVKQKNKE